MQTDVIESPLTEWETPQTWPAGAPLFHEGEEPRGVYVLRSGQAGIQVTTREGKVRPLRVASAGQILGLSAVVMRRPYECSAVARTRCEAGFIDRDTLLRVIEDRPSVRLSLLSILSSEVKAAFDEIRSFSRR